MSDPSSPALSVPSPESSAGDGRLLPQETVEVWAQEIQRFFTRNQEDWRSFVQGSAELDPPLPLQALAKFFVIRTNLPFDMHAYMKAQAESIRAWLAVNGSVSCFEHRQVCVSGRLRGHGQRYRDEIILEQVRRIGVCWERIEAGLQALLTP